MDSTQISVIDALIRSFGVGVALLIAIAIALVLLLARGLDAFVKKRVEATADEQIHKRVREHTGEINRQLEAYKSDLAIQADAVRSTFQRQLQEFGLFASRRHDVYAELFRRLLEAEGKLAEFYGVTGEPTYEDCNRRDLEEEIAEHKIMGGVADRILADWDAGERKAAIDRLRDARREARRYNAMFEYQEARNYFLLNELFLSEPAAKAVQKAFEDMHLYAGYVRFPERGRATKGLEAKLTMNSSIEAVRKVLRSDLQRSDYSPPAGIPGRESV